MAYKNDGKIIGVVQAIVEEETMLLKSLPTPYHCFISLFAIPLAASVRRHLKLDHKIDLQPGTTTSWGLIYSLSAKKLVVL